jgi:hypothetical protein
MSKSQNSTKQEHLNAKIAAGIKKNKEARAKQQAAEALRRAKQEAERAARMALGTKVATEAATKAAAMAAQKKAAKIVDDRIRQRGWSAKKIDGTEREALVSALSSELQKNTDLSAEYQTKVLEQARDKYYIDRQVRIAQEDAAKKTKGDDKTINEAVKTAGEKALKAAQAEVTRVQKVRQNAQALRAERESKVSFKISHAKDDTELEKIIKDTDIAATIATNTFNEATKRQDDAIKKHDLDKKELDEALNKGTGKNTALFKNAVMKARLDLLEKVQDVNKLEPYQIAKISREAEKQARANLQKIRKNFDKGFISSIFGIKSSYEKLQESRNKLTEKTSTLKAAAEKLKATQQALAETESLIEQAEKDLEMKKGENTAWKRGKELASFAHSAIFAPITTYNNSTLGETFKRTSDLKRSREFANQLRDDLAVESKAHDIANKEYNKQLQDFNKKHAERDTEYQSKITGKIAKLDVSTNQKSIAFNREMEKYTAEVNRKAEAAIARNNTLKELTDARAARMTSNVVKGSESTGTVANTPGVAQGRGTQRDRP